MLGCCMLCRLSHNVWPCHLVSLRHIQNDINCSHDAPLLVMPHSLATATWSTWCCQSNTHQLSLYSGSELTLPKFECLQQLIKKRIWSSGVALRVFLRFFDMVAGVTEG